MSSIYYESELKENVTYKVQDIKKLSKDTKRFTNLFCLFKYVIGSTASGRITNTMQSIPVRALVNVEGYVANPVRASNAHGFAVIAQNSLAIPVGRAYLNPTSVDDTHASFDIEGKNVKLPLNILCSLVRIEEKKSKEIKNIEKKTGVSHTLVKALDIPSARKDIENPLPSFVMKLFPNLNLDEVKEKIKESKSHGYFDYEGNDHETILECDLANSLIRHKLLTEEVKIIVAMETERQMLSKI